MKNPLIRYAAAAFLLMCLSVVMGCSYTVKTGRLQASGTGQGASCSGASVLIVNAEKNGVMPITAEGRGSSGLRTDRQAWSKKIVEQLAIALSRRGCQVQANAKLTLNISLPDIIFKEDLAAAQFTVKMQVAGSNGWSKTYEGTAKTGSVSTPGEADKLAAQAFSETVNMMLNDAEFQKQLVKK